MKTRIAITVDDDLLPQIDQEIRQRKYEFRTRSQFIDILLKQYFERR